MKRNKPRTLLRSVILLGVGVCSGAVLAQAQLTTIWSFKGGSSDGELPYPYGHLPFDGSGALYGTTAAGGGTGNNGTVYRLVPPSVQGGAWTENLLYVFGGGADGRQPSNGVVFDQNGNLYGSTSYGGNLQACGGGCGTIFELSPPAEPGGEWTHTVLWTFQGSFDGQNPGEVVFGPNGALYGTTTSGGTPGVPCSTNTRIKFGCGTVFQLTPPAQKGGSWIKTIIYTFPATKADGRVPNSEITFDSDGNLYGMTASGGTSNYGIAYELTGIASGAAQETILHEFTGGSDGGYPGGTLVVGQNGAVYGTASYSGVANASGVVFQLTPPAEPGGAWTETVLHAFPAFKGDGTTPASTMAMGASGNLYGTTDFGGSTACYQGCGTIFKLAPPSGSDRFWTETILDDLGNSGQNPNGSLVTLHNGLLYGVTTFLGSADVGSVFTLVP
jgi:uncharacterized repeat protein (TIGR03803 family)